LFRRRESLPGFPAMANYYKGRHVTTVGWKALLDWVNDLLNLQLRKVEQCASGAVYCQILDMCYPETVEMTKVNWMAKVEHEYLPNYKVLQTAFDTNGIDRHFPVGEMIRGKFRDNFEMLQWMKTKWDQVGARKEYEPSKAREGKALPRWAGGLFFTPMPQKPSRSPSRTRERAQNFKAIPSPCRAASARAKVDTWRSAEATPRSPPCSRSASLKVLAVPEEETRSRPKPRSRSASRDMQHCSAVEDEVSFRSCSRSHSREPELTQSLVAREQEITLLRQERDFYYKKLRSAESLCNSSEASSDPQVASLIAQLQQILYKDDDEPEVLTRPDMIIQV